MSALVLRRSLALVALAAVAAVGAAPASAAQQVPPPPVLPKDCNIFQNCLCTTVNSVVVKATGEYLFHCV